MKRSISLLLFLMATICAYAQMLNDSTIQICAYWGLGDSAVYQCHSYSQRTDEKGERYVKKNLSDKRTFQVMEMTDSTYVLKVSYDDVVDSTAILNDLLRTAIQEVSESMTLEVLTDEMGTPLQYYHVDEILKETKKLVPVVMKSLLSQCDNKKDRRAVKKMTNSLFSQMFSSPQFIIQACDEDVMPLLSYHGGVFKLRNRYEVETVVPNILGGDFPCKEVFYADTLVFEGETFVVMKSVVEAGSEEIMPIINKLYMNLMKSQFTDAAALVTHMQEYEKIMQEVHMQAFMEMRTTTLIHLNSGWTYAWYYDRDLRVWSDESDSWEKEQKSIVLIDMR